MISVYTRLFRLYPSSFRARFCEEMLQFVRDEAAHGRRVHWMRTLVDLFRSAITERWKDNDMRQKVGIGLGVVALTFFVSIVVTGTAVSAATILVVAVELAVAGFLFGAGTILGRRVRGAEYDYALRRLRWWWVIAGLLGAAEVILSSAQLINEPKGTNVFAMFLLWGFASLVFAGMAIRNRRAGNYLIVVGVLPAAALFWSVFPPIAAIVVIVNALADNYRIANPRPAV